jgi:hypothetical protein
MEVQGIASVKWQQEEEHFDPDAPIPNPEQQMEQEGQMPGEGVN